MEPRYLVQLAVIIELGSVTKAARKLKLTQPTLSRSVRIIEQKVGGAVLRRDRYGVTATEIGARLAVEGREIMRRSESATTAIQQWKHGLAGELRVGVGPILAETIMGDFFANLCNSPPRYRLKVICEYAARLVDRLHEDQLDVAIMPHELNQQDSQLHRETLFEDHLAVFVGKDDVLANKKQVSATALAQHDWISIGELSGLFDTTREILKQLSLEEITPRLEITGNDMMIFRALEQSRTCCIFPFRQLSLYKEQFRIRPVDLDVQLPSRNVALWTTSAARDRPEVADFRERLCAYLEELGLTARA